MVKEISLREQRKLIPSILNLNKATAYRTGVRHCLELVKEQDDEFIELLKEKFDSDLYTTEYIHEIINKHSGNLNMEKNDNDNI